MRKRIVLIAVFVLLIAAAAAFAHGVSLWAEVVDGKVKVDVFLSNGTKMKNAKIVVFDGAGKQVLEGKTDDSGSWTFDPPFKDKMKIVAVVDDQHKAEFELTKEDFEQ